jgi:hypothetical protein
LKSEKRALIFENKTKSTANILEAKSIGKEEVTKPNSEIGKNILHEETWEDRSKAEESNKKEKLNKIEDVDHSIQTRKKRKKAKFRRRLTTRND